MGTEIDRTRFSASDFQAFSARLHDNLRALEILLQDPAFGQVPNTLGAELELYIIDKDCRALGIGPTLRESFGDSKLALELNRYNLEYNFTPRPLSGTPFRDLASDITQMLDRLGASAAGSGGRVLPIGILPSLREEDIGPAVMTDEPRYHALSDILIAMRGGTFDIAIDGADSLAMSRADLTAEGICTSLQVHFGFPIEHFVDTWNAMTLVTPLVLAVATNSPLLLGRRLWHETRVPLFKQSTDGRRRDVPWHDLARVDLGNDWLRRSVYELFAQRVYLYPPLIPLCSDENPMGVLAEGKTPRLDELNLHNGTIWHWNRPVYSGDGNGHIRVEMRSLPAGPSAIDMAANAAFHIGLAAGLRHQVEPLLMALPFRFAARNFTLAARDGMAANLVWPSLSQNRLWEKPVRSIVSSVLEIARRGLEELGVADGDRMLAVIEERVASGQSGSVWQLAAYENLCRRSRSDQALVTLVECYRDNALANLPVSRWQLPQ